MSRIPEVPKNWGGRIKPHYVPTQDDPPTYPIRVPPTAPAGTVVPPPSTYYPFSIQVSFLMEGGLLRSNYGPTISEPPDYMSIWTLLKTSASPLMHGDTFQLQTNPQDPTYNQWGANMMYNSLYPGDSGSGAWANFVSIWPYREPNVIADPRTNFAILRVDGATQPIIGATSVRILSIANGFYARRMPPKPDGSRILCCDAGVGDPETMMTIVELTENESAKRSSLFSSADSGAEKYSLVSSPRRTDGAVWERLS